MWKWIGGILLVIVMCIGGATWLGYRKLTASGDVASVTIAGSPERVFAALANHDSLTSWYILKGQPAPTGHGQLAVGDSLPAQTSRMAPRARASRWVADEVVPGRLLVLSLRGDTNQPVIAVRRDSLVSLGDSTQIVSTVSSPMMQDVRARNANGGGLIGVSSNILVSGIRMQSKMELTRLKNHIEGRPIDLYQP